MIGDSAGLTHISGPMNDLLKEIYRRAELRPRLEVELGQPLTDKEFLKIAESTGLRI